MVFMFSWWLMDSWMSVKNRSSVMSGVQRPGMLPTSPSVQPDPMPAMSPVSPEVGPLGGELGGAMWMPFLSGTTWLCGYFNGKNFPTNWGVFMEFSSKPCLISDISGWHVFFLQTTNGKIGYVGYGWVGLPHSIDFAQGINAVLVGKHVNHPF